MRGAANLTHPRDLNKRSLREPRPRKVSRRATQRFAELRREDQDSSRRARQRIASDEEKIREFDLFSTLFSISTVTCVLLCPLFFLVFSALLCDPLLEIREEKDGGCT